MSDEQLDEAMNTLVEVKVTNAKRIAELLEALRAVEWVPIVNHDKPDSGYCPVCMEYKESGHTTTCIVGKALRDPR